MIDLSTDLGRIRLKNPLICASSEFTMSAEGIAAALENGAGAVIAKSVNESPCGRPPAQRRRVCAAGFRLADGALGEHAD